MARAVRRSIKRQELELEVRRIAPKLILALIGMLLFGLLFWGLLPGHNSGLFRQRHRSPGFLSTLA